MLFTDEPKFCNDFTDRRARVWRARNERFAPVCVAEHDRYVEGSVMIWAGISMQGKTDLHLIENGTLTAVHYVNEILDVYVRPYAGAIGADFILMNDNARPHRAHVNYQYLEDATIVSSLPRHEPDRACLGHASESDFCSPSPANNGSTAQNNDIGGMGQTPSATAR